MNVINYKLFLFKKKTEGENDLSITISEVGDVCIYLFVSIYRNEFVLRFK